MYSLSSSYFIFFALIGIFVPYFNLYCHHIGFSSLELGYFLAIFSATKCISPIFWGHYADRTGERKKYLIVASWLNVIIFAGFFLTQQYMPMLILITLYGFFRAPMIPMVEAITWEFMPRHGWQYGRIRLWGSIGFICATLFAGILSDRYDIKLILYLMFGLLVFQTLFFRHLPDQKKKVSHLENPLRLLGKDKILIAFLTVSFLLQVSHGIYYSFFSIHMNDLGYGKTVIGMNWTVSIVCEVVLMLNYERWFGKRSPLLIIVFCSGLAVIRWVLLSKTSFLPFILATQSLHAFTFAAAHIASLTLLDKRIPSSLRTSGQTLYSSVTYGLGIMCGSALAGWAYDRVGGFGILSYASWISAAATIVATACFIWSRRKSTARL